MHVLAVEGETAAGAALLTAIAAGRPRKDIALPRPAEAGCASILRQAVASGAGRLGPPGAPERPHPRGGGDRAARAVTADATLEEVGNPEIIAIPGGIGSDHRTEIADWLRTVSPSWIISTSTGSALLAAAGLLDHETAATHWLAGPLLERYGAHPSREQLVVNNRIVTCAGSSSAFRGALVIAEAYGGQEVVERIRAKVWQASQAPDPTPHRAFWRRMWNSLWRSRDDEALSETPVTEEPALSGINVLDLGLITLRPGDDDQEL